MKYTEHTLRRAEIKNNCPECFDNNGMVLRFIQKERENAWYRKAEPTLIESLHCYTCETEIFPVRWDEHIERVYEYNKKLVEPKPSRVHLKKQFWITVSLILILIAVGIWAYLN